MHSEEDRGVESVLPYLNALSGHTEQAMLVSSDTADLHCDDRAQNVDSFQCVSSSALSSSFTETSSQ